MKTEQIFSVLEEYGKRNSNKKNTSTSGKGGLQLLCESLEVGLSIVGARPAMGSTSFVLSMALEMSKAGKRVLFYGHPHHNIEDKINRYVGRTEGCSCPFLKDIPFYFTHMFYAEEFQTIKASLKEDIIRLSPDCVFIDCLQDIPVDNRLIYGGMSTAEYLCRELRDLSYRMNVPVVATTRLNLNPEKRSGVEGKIPQIGDFRGGDLAYYASKVFFPHRPEYYHIYHDDRTGEEIRGRMYIYGMGLGENTGMELRFDYKTSQVYDPAQKFWVADDGSTSSDLPF